MHGRPADVLSADEPNSVLAGYDRLEQLVDRSRMLGSRQCASFGPFCGSSLPAVTTTAGGTLLLRQHTAYDTAAGMTATTETESRAQVMLVTDSSQVQFKLYQA